MKEEEEESEGVEEQLVNVTWSMVAVTPVKFKAPPLSDAEQNEKEELSILALMCPYILNAPPDPPNGVVEDEEEEEEEEESDWNWGTVVQEVKLEEVMEE